MTGLKWNLQLSWVSEAIKSNWFFLLLLLGLFLLLGYGKRNYFKEKCIFNSVEEQNSENGRIWSPSFNHCKCCRRIRGSAESHLITPLGWACQRGVISKDTRWSLDPCITSPGQPCRSHCLRICPRSPFQGLFPQCLKCQFFFVSKNVLFSLMEKKKQPNPFLFSRQLYFDNLNFYQFHILLLISSVALMLWERAQAGFVILLLTDKSPVPPDWGFCYQMSAGCCSGALMARWWWITCADWDGGYHIWFALLLSKNLNPSLWEKTTVCLLCYQDLFFSKSGVSSRKCSQHADLWAHFSSQRDCVGSL